MEKNRKLNKLVSIAVISIILSVAIVSAFHVAKAQENASQTGIIKFSNGIITVVIPANGSKPMFIWWYNNKNDTAYVFKYNGLAEIWMLGNASFTHKLIDEEGDLKDFVVNILNNATGAPIKEILNQVSDKLKDLENLSLINRNGTINKENIQTFISSIQNISSQLSKLPSPFKDNFTSLISNIINQLNILQNTTDISKAFRIVNQISNAIRDIIFNITQLITQIDNAVNHLASILRHPFYFPFDSANWSFVGPKNITASNGQVIGIQFAFKLTKVNDQRFKFAEGNITITNELFFNTVTYKSGNQTFKVTNAELKSDIIIKHWDWNLYETIANFKNNTNVEGFILNTIKKLTPSLILIAHFSNPVMQSNESEEFNMLASPGGEDEIENENSVVYTNQTKGFELGKAITNDTSIYGQKIYGEDEPTLIVKTTNATIAGFFRFVPYASLIYENGTKATVKVNGYFILEGRHVSVFLQYPYFGNATLMHDPTVGIAGAPISTQSSYVVNVSSNGEISATQQTITTPSQINWYYYIIAAIIAIVVIASFVFLIRRIKK